MRWWLWREAVVGSLTCVLLMYGALPPGLAGPSGDVSGGMSGGDGCCGWNVCGERGWTCLNMVVHCGWIDVGCALYKELCDCSAVVYLCGVEKRCWLELGLVTVSLVLACYRFVSRARVALCSRGAWPVFEQGVVAIGSACGVVRLFGV